MLSKLGYEVKTVGEQCIPDPDFSKTASPNPENKKAFYKAIEVVKRLMRISSSLPIRIVTDWALLLSMKGSTST